jgi:hypothetical protein
MASLVVVAFDAAGNSTPSAAVSVNVANADITVYARRLSAEVDTLRLR